MDTAIWSEFWQARNTRERWIIGLGVPLLLLSLLYAYLWMPINKERHQLRRQVPALMQDKQKLVAEAQEVKTLKAQVPAQTAATGGSDPLTLARQSAGSAGLGQVQLTPDNAGGIQVAAPDLPFDALMRWLGQLQSQYGLRVVSAQISALPKARGHVKVQITLNGGRT